MFQHGPEWASRFHPFERCSELSQLTMDLKQVLLRKPYTIQSSGECEETIVNAGRSPD